MKFVYKNQGLPQYICVETNSILKLKWVKLGKQREIWIVWLVPVWYTAREGFIGLPVSFFLGSGTHKSALLYILIFFSLFTILFLGAGNIWKFIFIIYIFPNFLGLKNNAKTWKFFPPLLIDFHGVIYMLAGIFGALDHINTKLLLKNGLNVEFLGPNK